MNTMLMSVAERSRDFGILRAIGGRNPGHPAPDSWGSLMHGSIRRDPWNPCGDWSRLCNECLACKNKDNAFSDNSKTSSNCHTFCFAYRGSFRALPCI